MPTNYTLHSIPNGAAGVRATLKTMSKITRAYKAAPAIRELALQLTRHLPAKNWSRQALTIQSFVKSHIRYTRDVRGVETLQSPIQTLRLGQGDCDDQAVLVASLLETIGHPTLFKAVGFAPGHFSHVYCLTKIAGKWVALETTENWAMGREPNGIKATMIEHN